MNRRWPYLLGALLIPAALLVAMAAGYQIAVGDGMHRSGMAGTRSDSVWGLVLLCLSVTIASFPVAVLIATHGETEGDPQTKETDDGRVEAD